MNSNPSPEVSNEDIAIMIEKLNKRRENGRMRAQKWYDSHKEEFQEERRLKKLERQEQKKTKEKREPMKRGRKVKPIDVSDVINGIIKI